MKADHVIFGVHITDRVHQIGDVQKILTDHGCNIKTRIGLHEVDDQFSSPAGVILLEMIGDTTTVLGIRRKLETVEGIEVKEMVFGH